MWLVLLAAFLAGILFLLTVNDFVRAKRERRNGPVQFMNLDNLRHQGFILLITLIVLCCFLGILDQETALPIVTVLLIIDAVLTFFRRRKMAVLVGEYLMGIKGGGVVGGKRWNDPSK